MFLKSNILLTSNRKLSITGGIFNFLLAGAQINLDCKVGWSWGMLCSTTTLLTNPVTMLLKFTSNSYNAIGNCNLKSKTNQKHLLCLPHQMLPSSWHPPQRRLSQTVCSAHWLIARAHFHGQPQQATAHRPQLPQNLPSNPGMVYGNVPFLLYRYSTL